jgi:hypothetical protein
MASGVPRLLRLEVAKQWTVNRDPGFWSPRELLAGDASLFAATSRLTVKRSLTSRFFMYEEQGATKLTDTNGPTQVLTCAPSELADLLHEGKNDSSNHDLPAQRRRHHYWTSPVRDVAPGLLKHLQGYESLHCDPQRIDPRGPSLWMGSPGSATQAHYDVADNVIVQLSGTKRIRVYHPKAATALYVFPDAHPRARKSQVNFDAPDHARFLNFASQLPAPVIDTVLQQGDALRIPAFWFHHVENGTLAVDSNEQQEQDQGPGVSLNLFALSAPMMVASEIFRDASRPFGFLAPAAAPQNSPNEEASEHYEFAVVALRALGWALFERLGMEGTPSAFIRTSLLDTRYVPLRSGGLPRNDHITRGQLQTRRRLTVSEEEQVDRCIARILPQFASLRSEDDEDGILSLVALHLLELWAVELVGAPSVEHAWEAVLLLDD